MAPLRYAAMFLGALLLQSLLFLAIPLLNALFSPLPVKEKREAVAVAAVETVVLKKEEQLVQKEIRPLSNPLQIRSPRLVGGGPPRGFSMDLSLATDGSGGEGVAVAIGAGGGANAVYQPGEVDEMARELRSKPSTYPQRALRERRNGRVELLLVVEIDGTVSGVEVVAEEPRGYGFGSAAAEAIRGTLFEPAKLDGVPVRQRYSKEFLYEPS